MSEDNSAIPPEKKQSMVKRVYADIKNDFSNIHDKLAGHVKKAEAGE